MARRLRVLAAVGSVCALALGASDAKAWTPTTHVYLAQKAWEDAQDGKVTINFVDHDARTVLGPVGEYDVSPEILAAIRANPHAFYAGVLGPDAYPDIATGQMRIHPPGGTQYTGPDSNPNGSGTDNWLQHVWKQSHTGTGRTPANIAWATGFLAHAAGDMYAHTFMNTFAGGIFDLFNTNLNGLKHITLEGYIGMRTPPLNRVTYPVGGTFDGRSVPANSQQDIYDIMEQHALANGLRDFISRTLVDSEFGANRFVEKNRMLSFPAIFTDVRNELRKSVDAYEAQERPLQLRAMYTSRLSLWSAANVPGVIARACGGPATACPDPTYTAASCPSEYPTGDKGFCAAIVVGSPGWFATAMAIVASTALTEWINFKAFGFRELRYLVQKSQINEIDQGLPAWIETSHDAARAWFFNPEGMPDIGEFIEVYTTFMMRRLVSMVTGLPSWPATTFGEAVDFFTEPMKKEIDKMKKDMADTVMKAAFGADMNTLKERHTRPQVYLNDLFQGNAGRGLAPINIARTNRILNVPITDASDLGATNVQKKTWTVDKPPTPGSQQVFPAAYNTMVMIKAALMSPAAVDKLVADLGGSARLGGQIFAGIDNNAMLGFATTIDGSHQWQRDNKMIFARDCVVYRKIFMNNRPIREPGDPGAQTDPLNPILAEQVEAKDPTSDPTCGLPQMPSKIDKGGPLNMKGGGGTTPNVPIPGGDKSTPLNFKGAPTGPGPIVPPPPPPAPSMTLTLIPSAMPMVVLPYQIVANDAKALPQGELPTHPPGALYPGQSIVLSLSPSDSPHKWSIVSGGAGRLVDPPDPTTGKSPQEQAAKLAELDKKLADASTSCKGDLRCVKRGSAALRKERRVAAATMRSVNATPLLGSSVVFEAPASVATASVVTIKADATDGSNRSATITIALLPQPAPLKITMPPTGSVKAGGTFGFVSDPPIPLKWSVVSGGGTIGADATQATLRTQIMNRDITPFTTSVRQADAKLSPLPAQPEAAPPPPSTSPRFDRSPSLVRQPPNLTATDRGKVVEERKALVRDRQKDLAAAVKRVQEIDGTFRAPPKAGQVVLKAVALDGTGRTTTITVPVTP